MDKTHGRGPLLSSSGCRGLKAAAAAPQGLGFSGTKQKHVGGGSASSACSPWRNGKRGLDPFPKAQLCRRALLAPNGAAEPWGEAERRGRSWIWAGGDEPEVCGCCVHGTEHGQSRVGFSTLELGKFRAGMSLVEVQSQVPILRLPSAFLASAGVLFLPKQMRWSRICGD